MEPVTLFEDREIKVSFDLAGRRLIPGCAGVLGEPIEQFLELYGVSADDMVRISTPMDLARITRAVRSPAEALEFVRLFTSPRTHYLFDRQRVLVDLVVSDTGRGGFGVIGRELAQRLALPPDHVSSEAGAFRIDRCLVGAESPSAARTVFVRSERVFPDGKYELVREQAVASLGTDDVTLPSYE